MRISKLMLLFISCITILTAAIMFNFDVFKGYALLGFILAVDSQIVMAAKAIREQAMLDFLKKNKEGDSDEHTTET